MNLNQSPAAAREERLADKLAAKWNLVPPVNIREILSRYASIEENVSFPNSSIDAILVHDLNSQERPAAFFSSRLSEKRLRFSMAHELGHLLIPWHFGGMICHSAGTSGLSSGPYQAMEAEANRFASRILLPTAWVESQLRSKGIANTILSIQQSALVSDEAMCLAVTRMLHPGIVVVVTDRHLKVLQGAVSPGTMARQPDTGSALNDDMYSKAALRHAELPRQGGNGAIHVWQLGSIPVATGVFVALDSRTILKHIFSDLSTDGVLSVEEATALARSVNGHIGMANPETYQCSSVDEVARLLYQKFVGVTKLTRVSSHQMFAHFILRKAEELHARNIVRGYSKA